MKKLALTGIIALGLSSGCVTSVPLDSDYKGPQPKNLEKICYDYSQKVISSTKKKNYVRKKIDIKSDDSTIHIDYYDAGKDSAVLVLPQLQGSDALSRYFARRFANKGLTSLIVRSEEQLRRDVKFNELNASMKRIVQDHLVVIDWLKKDIDKIGVFGISMGGVTASILAGIEEVDASLLGICGGDLPYILINSRERLIKSIRDEALTRIDKTELYKILKESFTHDPLKYAKHIDARNTLMIIAKRDKIVPTEKQEELRKMIGNPPAIYLPTGHYTSAIFIPYVANKAVRFFKEELK